MEQSVLIVVPMHKQPQRKWISALKREAKGYGVIVVDDSPDGGLILPEEWVVYDRSLQETSFVANFGEEKGKALYEQFKKFHRSSACRNFGHWVAYMAGASVIITLDSDCTVQKGFVRQHVDALNSVGYGWVNPIERTGMFPRGYPYFERFRDIVCNIGLWKDELDLGGLDRVMNEAKGRKDPTDPMVERQKIAHTFIPLCGMNTAFKRESIPAMLFLPNFDDGEDRFRRHDDIMGGYIYEKVLQKRREFISFGFPVVSHDSGKVDANQDAENERAMVKWEESFYDCVDIIFDKIKYDTNMKLINGNDYGNIFRQFVDGAQEMFPGTVFEKLVEPLRLWVSMYEGE